MAFIKHQLPCPKCGGSDPVSLNEDGSAKCFSCDTYFLNYNNLCKNKSIIVYLNCNDLEIIKNYTKDIQLYDKYKIAICYF